MQVTYNSLSAPLTISDNEDAISSVTDKSWHAMRMDDVEDSQTALRAEEMLTHTESQEVSNQQDAKPRTLTPINEMESTPGMYLQRTVLTRALLECV